MELDSSVLVAGLLVAVAVAAVVVSLAVEVVAWDISGQRQLPAASACVKAQHVPQESGEVVVEDNTEVVYLTPAAVAEEHQGVFRPFCLALFSNCL